MEPVNLGNNEDDLFQLLADADERGVVEDPASTVGSLRTELETIADLLHEALPSHKAPPLDPVLREAGCERAIELACRLSSDTLLPRYENPAAKNVLERIQGRAIGPYQLLELLGCGGMGKVYKALHSRLDKVVALKVLTVERLTHPELLNRFQREMKAVGKLDHLNLVRALDAGDSDGVHYLAMEYVAGLDLAALLKQRGPLPIAESCELVCQAACGLSAAHARGIVHRDIKPANLMLATQHFGPPVVKVLDLGLALLAGENSRSDGELTNHQQIMGTIDYMAPEQAQDSHAVDQRGDIYSLGMTLYALLTGGSWLTNRPQLSLLQKLSILATERVAPVRSRRNDVCQELSDILDRMLAWNPADRFQSMDEVIVALRPLTSDVDLGTLLTEIRDQNLTRPGPVIVPKSQAALPRTPVLGRQVPIGSNRSPFRIALTTVIVGMLACWVVWFSLKTPDGEVIVEIPDDLPPAIRKELQIRVTGENRIEIANETKGWKIGLREGKYEVQLAGGGDQLQVEGQEVTVTRREQSIIRVIQKLNKNRGNDPRAQQQTVAAADGDRLPNRVTAMVDPAVERRIAERVLDRKGSLSIRVRGTPFEVKQREQLPAEQFSIVGVAPGPDTYNDDLRELAPLTHLEKLNLGYLNVTAEGLVNLKECRELKDLWLFGSQVGTDAIPLLRQFPKLEAFSFPSTISDVWAEGLLEVPTLRKVTAYRADLTDAGIAFLARLPRLEHLIVDDCGKVTEACLKPLATCKSLRTLSLLPPGEEPWPEILTFMKARPECKVEGRLVTVDPHRRFVHWVKSIDRNAWCQIQVEDQTLRDIKSGQPLPDSPFRAYMPFFFGPDFDRRASSFVDEFALQVSGLRLKGLHLISNKLTAVDINRLLTLPELSEMTSIILILGHLDDSVLDTLAHLSRLSVVDLSSSPQFTGKGIRKLQNLTALTMIRCPNISLETIDELQQLPRLEAVQIGGPKVMHPYVARLVKLKVRELIVDSAEINDETAKLFTEMHQLERLDLEANPITDVSLKAFQKLKNLRQLNVSNTKVTAAGLAELQQALPDCQIRSSHLQKDPKEPRTK